MRGIVIKFNDKLGYGFFKNRKDLWNKTVLIVGLEKR